MTASKPQTHNQMQRMVLNWMLVWAKLGEIFWALVQKTEYSLGSR